MFLRKFTALAGVVAATALLAAGLGAAPTRDDESELGQLMEKVQAANTTILKGVRTAVNYKKSYDDIVKASTDMIQHGKDSRKFKEPAEEQKKPQAEWERLCDEFVKESEKFAEVVGKKETTQPDAKAAYKAVQKSCTDCHDVFRVEDE